MKLNSSTANCSFLLGFVLTLMISTSASAECADMSEAQAATLISNEQNDKVIAGLVSKWKTEEPARLIKFGAYVDETGRLENTCCISSTHSISEGGIQRLYRKIGRLRFDPATLVGERLRVYVSFTVVARMTDEGVQTQLLQNHLHSMNEFGMSYYAPQRVWSTSMWSGKRLSSNVYLEVHTTVDASGKASDARVANRETGATAPEGAILSRVESACFIPGSHNGVATPMLYAEAFTG